MMTTMNLKLPDPRRFFKWMLLICALSVLLLAIVCAIPTPLQARAEEFPKPRRRKKRKNPFSSPRKNRLSKPTGAADS